MIKTVNPSEIRGTIYAPSSKSYAQRALAIASLASETTTLTNLTYCNDTTAVSKVVEALGAEVTVTSADGRTLTVTSGKKEVGEELFIGESGLATRLFTPIASLLSNPICINGEGSILTRPISMMEAPLAAAGVEIYSNNGYLPLEVCGPICGGTYEVDGSLSSQFLTGLLIAMPMAKGDTTLKVADLKSKPYIDMTIEVAKSFGVEISHDNYKEFYIKGSQKYRGITYNIEGDWSGASCLLVSGAIAGSITIENLQSDSLQADKAIIDAIALAGAKIEQSKSSITVSKAPLSGFEFDATDCPDLFPALATLASACSGKTTLKGTNRLTHKESDRAKTIADLFISLGIKVDISQDDIMVIYGGEIKGGVTVDSANDHRIAMAAATAALIADKPITIERSEAVNKSYPQFWDDIKSVQCS